jgi:hypothetical protein
MSLCRLPSGWVALLDLFQPTGRVAVATPESTTDVGGAVAVTQSWSRAWPARTAALRTAAVSRPRNPWRPDDLYLGGDHHVHSQYSPDGMNPVSRIVEKAAGYGLEWMVITDHGGVAHEKYSIKQVTPDIEDARAGNPSVLVYQGLEWNIPGAEHGTVFVPPSPNAVDVLQAFEASFDGEILATSTANGGQGAIVRATSVDGEPYALSGLAYLRRQVSTGRIPIALMFANHPARRGLDSPHQIRDWRDTAPEIAVGMEGAPGHQAQGLPVALGGPGAGRGCYDRVPDANGDSFPRFTPTDAENPYRTYGGFDWFTAKVGGLWDSLLSEGRPWSVTATSDSHQILGDLYASGGQDFDTTGAVGPMSPVSVPAPRGDFWPGYYSTTLVAARRRTYLDVMAALQAGKVIAVHGRLIDGLQVRVRSLGRGDRRGVSLGGRTVVGRGDDVELTVGVILPDGPNHAGIIPKPAHVDLIAGPLTGPATDRDTFGAPLTRVIRTFDLPAGDRTTSSPCYVIRHVFRGVDRSFFLRLRGSDGNRLTSAGDPVQDVVGDADPWRDLWFYSSPIFVEVV